MSTTAIEQLLKSHGFDLARQKKHRVYKREDGTMFVTASTPSDWRAERKQISTLCRVLGTDKRTLLAPLERRRRRGAVAPTSTPIVWDTLPNADRPGLSNEKVPAKQENKLAKRLDRIERNRAAKAARRAERLDLFFERPAVLFVDTGEILFSDNRGMKVLRNIIARRIKRPRTATIELSGRYPTGGEFTAEEILTNPDVLCILNCPHCGVTFVFKDGSVIRSNRDGANELWDALRPDSAALGTCDTDR